LAAGDSLSLQRVEIHQAGRIAGPQPFELKVGARASLVCWAVMPSGTLRHLLSGLGLSSRAPSLTAASLAAAFDH